jgi:light-regulated signal transduction histidine kinase (bacteriophytochrome)
MRARRIRFRLCSNATFQHLLKTGESPMTQIVDKHHGKLEFQTRSGHGTTFAVVLPIHREPK